LIAVAVAVAVALNPYGKSVVSEVHAASRLHRVEVMWGISA